MLGPESVCPCMTSTTEYGRERDWHYAEKTWVAGSIWKLCSPVCVGPTRSTGASGFPVRVSHFLWEKVYDIVQLSFCESGISR